MFGFSSKVLHQKFGPGDDGSPCSLPGGGLTCQSPHLRAGEEMVRQRLSLLPRVFYSHPVGGVSASLPIVRFGARGCSALRHFIAVASGPFIDGDWPRGSITIEGLARAHSQKPDEAFAAAEGLIPAARRIELFSRTNRAGWSVWGDETGKLGEVA